MKKLAYLLITFIYITSMSYKATGQILNNNNLQNINENSQINIQSDETCDENNKLSNLENFKNFYIKIIENLSFRNTLWEQASNFIEISNKDKVAYLWATGIKEKNGTLLYAISNNDIKLQLKNLFKDNSSWVIEHEKNIIESFDISKPKKLSKNIFLYEITYKSIHTDGYKQLLKQTISVENYNKIYKICGFSDIIPKN